MEVHPGGMQLCYCHQRLDLERTACLSDIYIVYGTGRAKKRGQCTCKTDSKFRLSLLFAFVFVDHEISCQRARTCAKKYGVELHCVAAFMTWPACHVGIYPKSIGDSYGEKT